MRHLRTPLVGACLALSVLLPLPAIAQEAPPSPPTAAELAEQAARQEAELLREQEQEAAARAKAAATLEAYQAAQRRADAAVLAAEAATDRLRAAEARTGVARQRLDAYVASLYRNGGGSARLSIYSGLREIRDPDEFLRGLGLAKRVGGTQSNALTDLAEAEAAQARETERVAAASAQLEGARKRAATAKAAADEVVAQAAARVVARSAELAATREAAVAAAQEESLLAQAELIARERSNAPVEAVDGALVPRPGATCTGGITAGYPNGQLPTDALCPLWGTKGQMLRADAAAAFDEMSRAYAAAFGAPICVTDSYRNYDEQVAVALAKPDLAARPGTSNHGWGVALDLCDGVQSFGTPQHLWMAAHSMAFGWFHPAWAQQDGSKPEAWHWEFAG